MYDFIHKNVFQTISYIVLHNLTPSRFLPPMKTENEFVLFLRTSLFCLKLRCRRGYRPKPLAPPKEMPNENPEDMMSTGMSQCIM